MKYSVKKLNTPVLIDDNWFHYRLKIWEPAEVTEERLAPFLFMQKFYAATEKEAIAKFQQFVADSKVIAKYHEGVAV